MPQQWQQIASSPGFRALPPERQQRAQWLYFSNTLAARVPPEGQSRAWELFQQQYPLAGGEGVSAGGASTPAPAPEPPLSIPPGMGTAERAGLVPQAAQPEPQGDVLDQVLAAYGVPALVGATPEAKLAVLKLATEGRGPVERLSQGEPPPLAKRLAADLLAGTIGIKHIPEAQRFIEATPEAGGIPGALASGAGALLDPATLAAGGALGGGAVAGARALGAGAKIARLAGSMGGFAGFEGAAEGGRQIEVGDFQPGALGKSLAHGAAMGAALTPAHFLAKPVARYLAESAIFGTAGPVLEGRLPTAEDYAHSAAFVGMLHSVQGLSGLARRGLSKPRQMRTPEESQAVEAIPPEQMQAIQAEARAHFAELAAIKRAERIDREQPTSYQVQEAGGVPKATPLPRETPDQTKRLLARVPDDVLIEELAREQQSDSRRRLLQEEFDRRTAAPEQEAEPAGEISQADILARQKKGRRLALAQSPTRNVLVGALKAGDRVKTVQGDGKVVKVTQGGAKVVTDTGKTVSLFRGQTVRRYGEASSAGAPEFSQPQDRPLEPRPLETAMELQDYQEIVNLVPERRTPAVKGGKIPADADLSSTSEAPVSRETPAEPPYIPEGVEPPAAPPLPPPALPVAASEAPGTGKVPAPTAEAPQGAKEPWEMTREEYAKGSNWSPKDEGLGVADTGADAARGYTSRLVSEGRDRQSIRFEREPEVVDSSLPDGLVLIRHGSSVYAAKPTGPRTYDIFGVLKSRHGGDIEHFAVSGKYRKRGVGQVLLAAGEAAGYRINDAGLRSADYLRSLHRYRVAGAVRAGKPVPPEVLKDYPDLAPQVAAEAPIDLAARRAARPTGEEGHLNLGTTKPEKPSLKATAAAAGEFQPESKWGGDWWTEGLQNSLIRLDRLEKWGRAKGATAWLGRKAEAYIGRAGHRIEKSQAELEGILKPAFDAGFKPSELGRYMQALHVEERQRTMAERGFKGDDAAGMTVAEARQIIASMPPEIAEHAAKLRAYIDGTLDILVDGQLIPAEVAAEWRQRWPNYVPLLRDFGAGEAVTPGQGRGFSASAGVKKAKGSKREALPVLAQMATARARAIDLAERGRVGRELLKTIEETGLEKQGWRVEDAESFFVDKDGELMLREATKDMKNKDNVISVPVEGRTVKIVIPPDQQGVIRAMNGLGVERSIPVLREVNQYLRYMATTGNLEFLITNFSRDLQEAQIHLAEKGPKVQAEVLRDLPAALKGIADHLSGRDTEWAQAREEMAAAGGLTHWSKPARDINKMAAEIEKMAERIETARTPETRIANGARLIGRGIEGMNEVVEGGVRLSAYRALRRAGVGAEEAAMFAKNMTLNFDKKGRWGGLIGSAYLFFNVGVQGPVRMAQFAKKNPGKFAAIASTIATAGYLEAMHNHSANPEEYEKRSTWERDNFWSFMQPGSAGAAAVLRVPYGYNFFKAIGATGYDVRAGLMSERDATNRVFKALVDGFSPVDDILPSALAPFIQIRMNKNWFGGPIHPEQPAYSAKVPDSQLYFKSARPQSVSLAKRLNEMTGGNEVLSGWFDVSPENMDYLVDFAGGGVGKLAGRTTSTLTSLARGDEIDPNQIPFARQFYRVSAKGRERSEVYHMLDESGRRIFTDAEVERFNRYMERAVELGDMDEKKAARYRKQFAKNQEAAVASTMEEQEQQ